LNTLQTRKRKILMANSKVKRKYICPTCKGNGFLKITYPEEMIQQCWDCDSQGELYEYVDEEFDPNGLPKNYTERYN
jgi:DnaJ-class molecular chaperone